jgi:cell division protein FtsW (lipid II flippase)
VYVTREDDKSFRWWNVVALALFVAFLLWSLSYEHDYRSWATWVFLLTGLVSVVLLPAGARVKRGRRPPLRQAARGE